MAKKWWPGIDPIGRTFRYSGDTVNHFTIAGIVGDVREAGLDRDMAPQLYLSIDRNRWGSSRAVRAIESAVRAANPAQPVYNLRMMESVVTGSIARLGVDVHGAPTFPLVPIVLAVPALMRLPPTRRAVKVNPADVMRAE